MDTSPDAAVAAEQAVQERAAAEQAATEQAAAAAQLARVAALERAVAAKEEAATAIRERDAAAARAHDALERATRDRLVLEPSADNIVTTGVSNVHDAMLLQEAAAVLNLHAQAVAVQNIRSLVPLVLDLTSNNYNRWRESMLLTLGKYSLQDHVLSDAAMPTSPDWARMNCVVQSWLLGTISTDLFDTVMNRGATARTTWLALESQFLGNRETRALYLDAEFRNFVQGDLSITEYCRRFKGMADALSDLGEVVTDRTLVLNLRRTFLV